MHVYFIGMSSEYCIIEYGWQWCQHYKPTIGICAKVTNLKHKQSFQWLPLHFLKSIFIVIQLQLFQFSPFAIPCLAHTLLHSHIQCPPCCPYPQVFFTCFLTWSFPFFPPLSHSSSLLVPVSLFFISMSLTLCGSFVCLVNKVPLIGQIIRYLYFTSWLISLSIIFSSSVNAVTKGRSSFFLLHSIPLCKRSILLLSTHLLMNT